MADDEYNRKLESLQQYIPFLNNMIIQLKDPRKKNREQQLTKMVSLHSMITDKKKKLKLETLTKCEDVILKLYDKVKSGSHAQVPMVRPPPVAPTTKTFSPITPSSPSPPRDIPRTKPVVIPTEKVVDRDSKLCQPSGSYKAKIDVYSSAADSLKTNLFPQKMSVFDRLGKKAPDMSKPPISLEDLEALQDDSDDVDTEKMSLNELTDLREKLQKQLSTDGTGEQSPINTTVRNTTILTKKAVDKTVPIETNKSKPQEIKTASKTVTTPSPVKPVKVIKEATSIFGSTLSSIDNKILEGANGKLKDKERRNSNGSRKDTPAHERRSSKDEKKPESSHKSSKDKKSTTSEHQKNKEKREESDKKSSKEKKSESSEKKPKDDAKKHEKSKKESKDEVKEKPKVETSAPPPVQTFKRLADKYNPKPRKLSVEALPDVPKNVSESIESSMKSAPVTIPFLDVSQAASPPKPVPAPQTPLTVPLLSPASSTNSIDSEINKKFSPIQTIPNLVNNPQQIPTHVSNTQAIPAHVSNILANPNATAIINSVVNQFKGRQTPGLLPPPPPQSNFAAQPHLPSNNHVQQPNFAGTFPGNEMGNMHYNNQGGMIQGSSFWSNQPQNYPPRAFTPMPPNQFDNQMQQMDYYPPGSAPAPNPFNHQAPPILSPQYENFDGRGAGPRSDRMQDDGLFGNKDRDMRFRDKEWRRPPPAQWPPREPNRDFNRESPRDPNRDPRLQRRDPRSYRDDPRNYRRDSREYERDSRPQFRDPRLNRYSSSGGRYERDQTPNRSRSRSRDSDDNNTFASPLDSLYSNNDGYRKTGKGYGVQHFKIPKIKKEGEENEKDVKPEVEPEPSVQPEPEPKPQTSTTETSVETNESTTEIDENVASTSVSSSTECDDNKPKEAKNESNKESAEIGEISSTNDIQEGEARDETKINEPNQTDIINKFLKKLLENERTRAAASLFIDNVSNSLDDEKLKMVVQTVKSATLEEETQEKRKIVKRKTKLAARAAKKKQVVKRKLRWRQKQKRAKISKKEEEEEEEEEPEPEEKKEVVVTVGERIKSRKRLASTSAPKNKRAKHKTELDLLHEDIQDMFIRDGVLTATGKRMCRLLKSDADSNKPPPPQIETRTRRKASAEKFDSKASGNSDKLKVMSNVRVLIPKISVDKLSEFDDEGQRYSLRRSNKPSKSYVEDESDEEKDKEKEKESSSDAEDEEKTEEPKEEEKEKVSTPPKKIAHRKRAKAWASGIIPKRKKKEASVEEKSDESEIADKSFELVEPDKNYYSSKPWHFKTSCKLCDFAGKNITQHYRQIHPESEILSSRLSPTKAEQAIKESLELKLDESEDVKILSTKKFTFKCRFCDFEMNSKPSNFYDHVSTHTGEYRHICSICSFGLCNTKPMRIHYLKVHGRERHDKSAYIKTKIYGYICLECNFVQMNKKTVENHVNIYHLGEGKKILKIHLSSIEYERVGEKTAAAVGDTAETVETENKEQHVESETEKKKTNQKEEIEPKKKKPEEEKEESPDKNEERPPKKQKTDEALQSKEKEAEAPIEKEAPIQPVIKKEKEIDMTVFTCNTDIQEENEKIEQERLKKMTELNDSVKTNRQSLNFVEQLRNRLLQEQKETTAAPEMVIVKSEPIEQVPEPEIVAESEPEPEPIFDVVPEMTPKKPSKVIEAPSSNSVEVVHKDNVKIQGMIQKLQGILKEEKTGTEGPPPLTPLLEKPKDDVKVALSAGFLNIVKDSDGLEYACRVPSCLFTSKDRDKFVLHWNEDHTRVNQNYKMTKCRICHSEISATLEKTLLSNFFTHVEEEHLGSRRNILRTRRLSGDKLSTNKEETEEDKEDFDIKLDENPFPFKISGVMSLAEDPIPPLSPIKEKQSPKIESVVLKEAKMSSSEKTAQWKDSTALKKFLLCPRELYKCPQFFCKFATNWRHLFDSHVKAHSAIMDELVSCVYCDVKTPLSHAGLHIDLRHSNSLHSCSQCLYRALSREYVMVHMKLKHKESDSIISLPPKTAKTIMMSKQKRYTVKEACQPYRCGYTDCNAEFLYQSEFTIHLENNHEGIMLCGYKNKQLQCTYNCVITDNMIDHWRSHNCYHFHCLICKVGSMELYTMLEHYSIAHPNLEPVVVDRRTSPGGPTLGYTDEACAQIKYLNQEILDSINAPQYTVEPQIVTEPAKNLTIVPLSIIQGPSKPEKKIIAIIPKPVDKTVQLYTAGSQPVASQPSFVFAAIPPADDGKKDDEEGAKDEARIEEVRGDLGGDPLSLEGGVSPSGDESDSQEVNESAGMKSFGLIGYQLYRCAFCDISFSNARDFKTHSMHSKQCRDNSSTLKPFKCVHCERFFKNPHGLLEHIQYHGQLRFCCSLCIKKFPSSFSLKLHMRTKHNVTNTITTPLVPNKTNIERDEFVLRPVPVAESEGSKESTNSQHSPNHKKVYSPSEVDQLPKRYIFNSDVRCAICSYSTKVRTNLVRHLQFHSAEKSVPDIAPVNPVPCLDKNEKMFDKMTNLAMSSFTTSSRMGGPKTKAEPKEVNEQVEVPAYVPSHRRYVCCANGCNYLCLEEANLRHHLFALHEQESSFTCAHCKTNLKTDIDGFLKHLKLHDLHLYKCSHCQFVHNLKHKVDKHSADKHPDKAPNTVTVRALEAEVVEVEQGNGAGEPHPPSNIKWTKPWHCGMCKYRCAAKNDIITHIFNKHDINTQFKCTLCSYKTNEKQTFDEHFKENHPNNEIDIIHVYYKSEGVGQSSTTSQKQFDTTPLWQRDRPRIRHIRGILFEETSSSQKGTKKTVAAAAAAAKSASTSAAVVAAASNLDLSIEAVAKGMDDATKAPPEEEKPKDNNETIIIIDDDEEEGEEMDECEDNLLIDVEAIAEDKVKVEPDKGLLSEEMLMSKYGKMCTPIAKAFRCPICYKFRTKKISYFIYHLLLELKCHRFKCNSCDYSCVTFDSMVTHCQEEHNSVITDNVTDTPLDKEVEYWIQTVMRYQAKAIIAASPLQSNGEEIQSSTCRSQCEFCQRWFKNIHVLKEHELYHWAEHGYVCGHCCSEQATLNELFQHSFIVHPRHECSVNTTGPHVAKIISTLKSPPANVPGTQQGSASEEVLYSCSHCSETEKSVELLQKHYAECHTKDVDDIQYKIVTKAKLELVYCCSYCHEKGSDDYLKKHHAEKHQGSKFSIYQYICLECSGTFLNIKDLRGHFGKAHAGKKLTYSCIENKATSSKDQYCCIKCPFRSCSVGGIRSHVRKHLRPIDCTLCGATFIYPTEARAHHNKEHIHNAESVEENKERLKEYEEIVQQIVAAKERGEIPKASRPSPPRRMLARKSTGAPFVREYSYYGAKKEQVDLKSVSTSIEVNKVTTRITVEQFSNIFNIFPVVEVRDCENRGS